MCTEIFIEPDGPELSNVREARAFLGEIITHDGGPPDGDDNCLCNVNCQAMLKREGYSWKWDGLGYVARKRRAADADK